MTQRQLKKNQKNMGLTALIRYNKRRTKNEQLIKRNKFTKIQKAIYKKRIIIENIFSWIYKNRRTSKRYDKKVTNYMSFLFIALTKILLKRL
jgi:transposase